MRRPGLVLKLPKRGGACLLGGVGLQTTGLREGIASVDQEAATPAKPRNAGPAVCGRCRCLQAPRLISAARPGSWTRHGRAGTGKPSAAGGVAPCVLCDLLLQLAALQPFGDLVERWSSQEERRRLRRGRRRRQLRHRIQLRLVSLVASVGARREGGGLERPGRKSYGTSRRAPRSHSRRPSRGWCSGKRAVPTPHRLFDFLMFSSNLLFVLGAASGRSNPNGRLTTFERHDARYSSSSCSAPTQQSL